MEKIIPEVTLNDGLKLPVVGMGTYLIRGNEGVNALLSAMDTGYRLLDSAYNYENEGTIGEAVRRTSVPREKLRITSKLPGRYQEYDKAVGTIQESLYRAGLDYYDLYLIHWPNPSQDKYVEAWQALIDAKKWGLIRSIGVCNFLPEHIDRLEKETGVLPSVNQVELHPFFNQEEQRKYHAEKGIVTQSWSPLTRGIRDIEIPELQQIAEKITRPLSRLFCAGIISLVRFLFQNLHLLSVSLKIFRYLTSNWMKETCASFPVSPSLKAEWPTKTLHLRRILI